MLRVQWRQTNRSQRNFTHFTTVILPWRVQNFVSIGRVHLKPEHCEFWSNSIEISLMGRAPAGPGCGVYLVHHNSRIHQQNGLGTWTHMIQYKTTRIKTHVPHHKISNKEKTPHKLIRIITPIQVFPHFLIGPHQLTYNILTPASTSTPAHTHSHTPAHTFTPLHTCNTH